MSRTSKYYTPRPRKLAKVRFFEKVVKSSDGCWLWTGARNQGGYGTFGFDGRVQKAHRVSWQFENCEIPDWAHVLHRCDVRACVNPDHLFLGTHFDNMRDMISKGRGAWQPDHSIAQIVASEILPLFTEHDLPTAEAVRKIADTGQND